MQTVRTESKVWLVTGSSRGLGRSIVAAAAAAGARVMATARRPGDLDDLVAQHPDRVRAVALDVTDPQAAVAAVQATIEAFGRLDVVVNNAGYANSAPATPRRSGGPSSAARPTTATDPPCGDRSSARTRSFHTCRSSTLRERWGCAVGANVALGDFLRTRRLRISPASVGLPAGPRRRTPGLRREEIATLAGLSPTWYIYLEQGRAVNPSPDTIDRIAAAMRLTEEEHRYLQVLAWGRSMGPRAGSSVAGHEDLIRRLVMTTEAAGLPVYAVDITARIIAANAAVLDWYGLRAGDNLCRWLVLDPDARRRLPNWTEELRDMVARWRLALGRQAGDSAGTAELVREMGRAEPALAAAWDSGDVAEQHSRPRVVRHPTLGERTFQLVVVRTSDRETTSIVHHLPTAG